MGRALLKRYVKPAEKALRQVLIAYQFRYQYYYDMSVLNVSEAANKLGVSERRVRQMLADGVLVGGRVGRAWVIDAKRLGQFDRCRRAVGRPWSPLSAWAVLALADGSDPVLSPVERSRAKKRLGEGLGNIVGRLGARAARHEFYGHPAVLDRLHEAPCVVRGGSSAAFEHAAEIVVLDRFEGYVKAADLAELVSRFGLDGNAERPNVLLRSVGESVWPFAPDQQFASRAVLAVDLLESGDPRSRRAGAALLESA